MRKWFLRTRRSGTTPRESRELRRWSTTLHLGRSEVVTRCRAQGVTRCKEEESKTCLMLIATLWKQGEISGICLGNPCIATSMSCPEKKLNVPAESSTPTPLDHIDIVRQTETSLDNLEGSGSSRFRILNKRPLPPSRVIHGWRAD